MKQLAPMAVMPPSPNSAAWMTSAMLIAITAAHGPSTIAIRVAPTACPVDPPMTGTLNIMMTNAKAAPSAIRGICLALSVRFTLRAAMAQIGIITTSRTAQV